MILLLTQHAQFHEKLNFQLKHANLQTSTQNNLHKTVIAYSKTTHQALTIPAQNYILISPPANKKTIQQITTCKKPLLFIHGTADTIIPPSHTEALSLHATHKKVFWITNADHEYSQPYHTYQLIHHIIHHLKEPMCYKN